MVWRRRVRVRWWVGLGIRWVVAPVVALLVIRGVWGMVAERRGAEARGELAAAGFASTVEAYLGPAIPDAENAVLPVLHAIDELDLTKAQRDLLSGADKSGGVLQGDFGASEDAEIDGILRSLDRTFGDLNAAMARSQTRWPRAYLQEYLSWPKHGGTSRLADIRFLSEMAGLAARRAHERHDEAECVHHIRQILALARVTQANPLMISHLMASAVRSFAAETVDQFLPELRLDDSDGREARALLAELLDDEGFQRAKVVSCSFQAVYAGQDVMGSCPQAETWVLRPLGEEVDARRLRTQLTFLPAAKSPIYDARLLTIAPTADPGGLTDLTFCRDSYSYSYRRILLLHAQSLADTRAAGVLLGARLHREQHGSWPASLAQLSSSIGAAPADPFARDGAALGYRVDVDGPTVWSVGQDGVDDHGVLRVGAVRSKGRYGQADIVYGAGWRAFSGK